MIKINIEIFVTSHKESVKLEHPLLKYVQVGPEHDDVFSYHYRDNDGENISEKNESFCELTTQYWAWKNKKLDYYGFCHYRRFFVFSENKLSEDVGGNVILSKINDNTLNILGYNRDIESEIQNYDILVTEPYNVTVGKVSKVYWQYKTGKSLYVKDLDTMIDIIIERYPEYRPAMDEYLNGTMFYQANMFIMNDKFFQIYNQWMFDILFEVEKRIDLSLYSKESTRVIGHLGERLLGIFVKHIEMNNLGVIGVVQRCLIENTDEVAINPAFESGVPIVMASNDYFAPYAGATILSIMESSSDEQNYDIVIMGTGITKDSKNLLNSLVRGKKNFSIRVFDVENMLNDFSLSTEDHISKDTYSRFLIPIIFSKYSKVLYLDGDLIVKADVQEIFDINLGNKIIGAVRDIGYISLYNGGNKEVVEAADNILKLEDPYSYFNAGVLVINVKRLSEKYPGYELMEHASKHKYRYMDQDVLNELFQNEKIILGMEWNVMHYLKGHREALINEWMPKQFQKEYMIARENPKIVHYAGNIKPWTDLYEDLGGEFWKTIQGSILFPIIYSRYIYDTIPHHNMSCNDSNTSLRKTVARRLVEKINNIPK